jgi:uncharacterized protein (TIGR02145 family)
VIVNIRIGFTLFIILGLLLILTSGCKKEDNSNEIIFNPNLTYGTLTDIEGNVYKTITIGTQTWMAENLKTTKLNNGTALLILADNFAELVPCYSWFINDEAAFKNLYGALYNFFAVNTGKLCPTGWHVPTNEQWETLVLTLDPGAEYNGSAFSQIAGGKLKEASSRHWYIPNTGATNESGFTALPGGSYNADFGGASHLGYFWSSTAIDNDVASHWRMDFNTTQVHRLGISKLVGFSIRCVKD